MESAGQAAAGDKLSRPRAEPSVTGPAAFLNGEHKGAYQFQINAPARKG